MNIIQYDTWNNLFSKNNEPLIGRIVFKDKNTQADKDVYDNNGNNIGNIVYVNGVTDYQVFLDASASYTAYLYQYIGDGSFRNDADESNWLLIRTIDVIGSNESESSNVSTTTVYGIDALRSIDTSNIKDGTTVAVIGYYEVDDCPLRYYRWSNDSTLTIDGGIVVGSSSSSSSGRWILNIPGDYIDVRWYGDIPQSSTTGTVYMSQRALAAQAATRYDKKVYFPSGIYIFDGSNVVTTDKDIFTDDDVIFHCISANQTIIECANFTSASHSLFSATEVATTIDFTSDYIRTSWISANANDKVTANVRKAFIIDSDTSYQLSNVNAIVEQNIQLHRADLDNVTILSGHDFLSGGSLSNMNLKDEWFNVKDVSKYTFTKCSANSVDFNDMNFYIDVKNALNDSNYGDLKGYSVNGKTLLNDAVLTNAKGSITVLNAAVSHSELKITLQEGGSVSIVDSNVELSGSCAVLEITASTVHDSTFTAIKTDISDCILNKNNFTVGSSSTIDSNFINDSTITVNATVDGFYNYIVTNNEWVSSTLKEYSTVNATRNSRVTGNVNMTFDDTYSNVIALGQSFEWDNNGDLNTETVTIPYIGYDRDGTSLPPWSDYDNAVYYRDNEQNAINNWGYANYYNGNSTSNTVYDGRLMYKLTLNMNQPWKYPANSLNAEITMSTSCSDAFSTTSYNPKVVRSITANESANGIKYYNDWFCGRLIAPTTADCTATIKYHIKRG